MFGLNESNLALYILIPVVGYLAAKWLYTKDTEVENRRRAAANLAATLQAYGLKRTPQFLISYSVGDYSGMGGDIVELAKLFAGDPKQVVSELDAVYERVLATKLGTEEGRALIAAKLGDAVVSSDPNAIKDAPKAKVAA